MKVVTFNIQHGRTPEGTVDIDALARYCASLAPDVLALQEVDVGVPRSAMIDTVARVAAATGMAAAFGRSTRVGAVGRYGNALLVRGALRGVKTVRLPRVHPRSEVRTALTAGGTVAGRALSLACTHLSIHEDEAMTQLQQVLQLLGAMEPPRLLVGDLNLRPDQLGETVAAAGLRLADTTVPTFPADAPRIRIDHVAVAGLELAAVEVLPAAPVSDHRALVVEVA